MLRVVGCPTAQPALHVLVQVARLSGQRHLIDGLRGDGSEVLLVRVVHQDMNLFDCTHFALPHAIECQRHRSLLQPDHGRALNGLLPGGGRGRLGQVADGKEVVLLRVTRQGTRNSTSCRMS